MISILYIVLILILLNKNSFFNIKGINKFEIITALFIHLIAGAALYFIYTKYYSERYTADIFKYYDDSLVLYDSFFSNPLDFFRIILGLDFDKQYFLNNYFIEMNHWDTSYKNSLMNGSRMVIKINAILNIIGLKSYIFNMLTFIFISFLGKFLIIKSIIQKFNLKYPKLFFWSITLIPTIALWSSGILKEPLIILSFGLILHTMIGKRIVNWLNLSLLIIGLGIIFKVKFYVFICFFPALISFVISNNFKFKPIKVIPLVCLILFISIGLLTNIEDSYNPLYILANKQNDFIRLAEIFDAGSSFKMIPIQPNLISLIKSIPNGLINGFLRPFPTDIHKLIHLFPLIENLVIYGIIAILIYKLNILKVKLEIEMQNIIFNSIFFVTILFVITGISTPVIGALVRYKVPGLIFIIITINLLYDVLKKNSTQ